MKKTQEKLNKTLKNAKGITLIALVITIIVLLILAGVSIEMITGDGGIIGKANDAKLETEKSDIQEQINTIVIRNSGDYTMNKDKLIGDFEEELPDGKEIEDSGDLIYIIYPDYSFEVDIETGEVTPVEIEKVEDETPWELAGSGTEADPYLIESIEDLVAFSNSVNEGEGNPYSGKYVKLTRTLDFNSSLSYDNPNTKVSEKTNRIIKEDSNGTAIKEFLTSGTGFNPIGSGEIRFYGNFEGNGKTIKEIYINRPNEDYVGLFGANSGTIMNLGLTGEIIGGTNEQYSYVGGIAGCNFDVIKYCYNKANITFKREGGSFGDNRGEVTNCYNIGKIKGVNSFGGIASGGGIKNSYNAGEVGTKEETYYFVGGISSAGDVSNCYNLGNVSAGMTYQLQGYGIGGIVGTTQMRVINCYNKGRVFGYSSTQIGGILGNTNITEGRDILENNYYLEGTAKGGAGGKDIEGQAMPLPESEMPSVISVLMTDNEQVEWNGQMVDVWKEDTNNINNGYPILYWQ